MDWQTKMAKIYVTIDGETVEATGEILEEILQFQAEEKAKTLAKENEEKVKAKAKAELLDRLGITAEEAKLLLA